MAKLKEKGIIKRTGLVQQRVVTGRLLRNKRKSKNREDTDKKLKEILKAL